MTAGIAYGDNTGFSASYLPAHAECRNEGCDWSRNFDSVEAAENAGLRHRCRDEDFMPKGRSIIQIIKEDTEDKYREWARVVEAEGMETPQAKILQGRLQGACEALAVMYSPAEPNPQAIAQEIQEKCDG